MELGVTVVDGGSPKRYDYARIEILIKTISGKLFTYGDTFKVIC